MTSQAATAGSVAVGRRNVPFRASPSARRSRQAVVVSAASKQEQPRSATGVQRFAQAGAHLAMSIAAAHMMTLPFAGAALAELPPQVDENADFGPNEVTKKTIKDTSVSADNPFDTAAPGRAGQTFGEEKPGQGDVGAVDEGKVKDNALKASTIVDKIKSALPFSTLPVFDLADLDKDTADFGPNEVSKDSIQDISLDADNPFDTAAPGRAGQTFGAQKPGEGDVGAVNEGEIKDKALSASGAASSLVDKIKSALPFQTLPVFDLADLDKDTADFGPNEVSKDSIQDISLDADNPFDTAAPGRAGQTFGAQKPGEGDVGAVNEDEIKDKALSASSAASSLVDKIKSALPFQTLPVFDLSVAPDDKNLGPNEVSKGELAKLPGADNKFDTATPGRAGDKSGNQNALDKAQETAQNPKGIFESIKNALSN